MGRRRYGLAAHTQYVADALHYLGTRAGKRRMADALEW